MDNVIDTTIGAANGSMGLKGIWALVGNSTAMVVVALVMFYNMVQVRQMHEEGVGVLIRLHEQERDYNRQANDRMSRVVDQNSQAIQELVRELRHITATK